MSRETPIKIDPDFMRALADMTPVTAGLMIQWGWRTYEGCVIDIEQEGQSEGHDNVRMALNAAYALLDQQSLANGCIEVSSFSDSRQKANELSRTRAKARQVRIDREAEQENVIPIARYVGERGQGIMMDRTKGDQTYPAAINIATSELTKLGMAHGEAFTLVEKLSVKHSPDAILSGIMKMHGRRVGNPSSYLQRTMDNTRPTEAPENAASKKALIPVRRIVAVGKGAAYEFVGWTPEGHPRAQPGVKGRRKVWRTDNGKLTYKRPDLDEEIPDFETIPGIYEVD